MNEQKQKKFTAEIAEVRREMIFIIKRISQLQRLKFAASKPLAPWLLGTLIYSFEYCSIKVINSSKRYAESWGPAEASG